MISFELIFTKITKSSKLNRVFTIDGLQLPEGGDFEALHVNQALNLNRSTKLQTCTLPRLTQNSCYKHLFFNNP
ncbi:MAG: hypothetical protein FJX80_13775 [Bacteroidetes bacterium]|nr:hypothetical protein [Bacteroidota bacterium]